MSTKKSPAARKAIGLGFLPDEARHGFVIDISRSGKGGPVFISELRGPRDRSRSERRV